MPTPRPDVEPPRVRQGDVLVTDRLPIIVAPGAPLTPDEAAAPPGDPVTTMEVLASSGLLVVVSQDCDLDRAVAVEPYLVAAPLRELSAGERARPGMRVSMRSWPFPDPQVRGREFVLDGRIMVTLSKGVLTVVPILRDHLQEPERTALREWLGARLGRAPWDAEVERKLVRPLERAVAQVGTAAGDAGSRVLGAVRFVGLRFTPGRPDCSVLMLTDPVALRRSGADDGAVARVRRQLVDALHRRVAAAGGTYIPRLVLADATMVSAADLLEHAPVDVDLAVEADVGA